MVVGTLLSCLIDWLIDWLINSIHRRKNCPTGMISGWVQKVTQHNGIIHKIQSNLGPMWFRLWWERLGWIMKPWHPTSLSFTWPISTVRKGWPNICITLISPTKNTTPTSDGRGRENWSTLDSTVDCARKWRYFQCHYKKLVLLLFLTGEFSSQNFSKHKPIHV